MTFYKTLPASSEGKAFELQQKVIGVYDKGKAGTVMESETVLREKGSKEVYVKLVGSTFFIGQGNWGGPKGIKSPLHKLKTSFDTFNQVQVQLASRHRRIASLMELKSTRPTLNLHSSTGMFLIPSLSTTLSH